MSDREWMQIALKEAQLAFNANEVPVGAIVVKNDQIVSQTHNLCEANQDPTAHAEMLALKDAYHKLGSLEDCTLYVTLEPCAMCAGAMLHMHLPRLVYGAFDPECGCSGSKIDLGDHWFDHSIETLGGICETECASILRNFFRELRNE